MRMSCVAFLVLSSALGGAVAGWAKPAGLVVAQLPRYAASGTHTCESGRQCVVSGVFSDCNDAQRSLQIRDCCPARHNGRSKNFAISYCIPDVHGR